jgi:hypothetical protein
MSWLEHMAEEACTPHSGQEAKREGVRVPIYLQGFPPPPTRSTSWWPSPQHMNLWRTFQIQTVSLDFQNCETKYNFFFFCSAKDQTQDLSPIFFSLKVTQPHVFHFIHILRKFISPFIYWRTDKAAINICVRVFCVDMSASSLLGKYQVVSVLNHMVYLRSYGLFLLKKKKPLR